MKEFWIEELDEYIVHLKPIDSDDVIHVVDYDSYKRVVEQRNEYIKKCGELTTQLLKIQSYVKLNLQDFYCE